MQGSELLRLVDAIHRERNVDKEVLFQALEHAQVAGQFERGTGGVD